MYAPVSYQNVRDPVNRKLTFSYVLWQQRLQAYGMTSMMKNGGHVMDRRFPTDSLKSNKPCVCGSCPFRLLPVRPRLGYGSIPLDELMYMSAPEKMITM
jgi:hypothetical protein